MSENQILEIARAHLQRALSANKVVWIIPLLLVEIEGKDYHVPTNDILVDLGARMISLNYWTTASLDEGIEKLMGQYIVKIKDRYLQWSTIVDAPISWGMTREDLEEDIRMRYGKHGLEQLSQRLARVEENGTSSLDKDLDDLARFNRAGPDQDTLTLDEIYQAYCLREPIRDGWTPK